MNKIRRTLIGALGSGAAAVSLVQLLGPATARAAGEEKLNPDAAAAKALQYTHNSPDASRRCDGCQFYQGVEGEAWGPCVIFPGKLVSADGVCNSWRAKSG